jgi:HPt (histidine-containing phosphotransfer) domain-containing protein
VDKGRIVVRGDRDLAALIPGFLDNRRKDLGTMTEAMARSDYERVRILGHSIKGSGGGYGFDTLTELGAQIESAATVGDRAQVMHALERLKEYLERVHVIYEWSALYPAQAGMTLAQPSIGFAYFVAAALGMGFSVVLILAAWYSALEDVQQRFGFESQFIINRVNQGVTAAEDTANDVANLIASLAETKDQQGPFQRFSTWFYTVILLYYRYRIIRGSGRQGM